MLFSLRTVRSLACPCSTEVLEAAESMPDAAAIGSLLKTADFTQFKGNVYVYPVGLFHPPPHSV